MKVRNVIIIVVVLALGVGGFLFARSRLGPSGGSEVVSERTTTIQPGTIEVTVSATGEIAPESLAVLAFRSPGNVSVVHVQVGDTVEVGETLIELDPDSMDPAIRQAEADLISAQQTLHELLNPTELQIAEAQQAVAEAQEQLETLLNPTNSQLAEAQQAVADAEDTLEDIYASVELDAAIVQNDIAQFQAQLEEAQRWLEVVAQPDVQYYQARAKAAENRLLQLELESEIIRIGSLTDAVDRAWDLLEDEEEFLQKVKAAFEGCKVAVESGDHTKLAFAEELTYRYETYGAGGVYDVPNWIADELLANYSEIVRKASLTCDPERKLTVDGRTITSQKAQDRYNDIVTQLQEAERKLEQEQLANQQTIRDTQEDLEKAKRNLAWAYSGKYSKQAIQAAETQSAGDLTRPESIEGARLQAEVKIALAEANLVDVQAQLEDLLDGPDSEDVAVTEATLADVQEALVELVDPVPEDVALAEATLADAQAKLAELLEAPDPDDVAAAEARVAAAQVQVAQAWLTAPFAGTVVSINYAAGDTVSAGQPAVVVADVSQLHIDTTVDELDIAETQIGQPATITLDALPGFELTGTVAQIDLAPDLTATTVEYPVKVVLLVPSPGPSEAEGAAEGEDTGVPVQLGMTAALDILVARKENVLLMPNWALRVDREQGGAYVFVQTAAGAERVSVELGLRNETYSEVISGLKAGDIIGVVMTPEPPAFRGPFGGGG